MGDEWIWWPRGIRLLAARGRVDGVKSSGEGRIATPDDDQRPSASRCGVGADGENRGSIPEIRPQLVERGGGRPQLLIRRRDEVPLGIVLVEDPAACRIVYLDADVSPVEWRRRNDRVRDPDEVEGRGIDAGGGATAGAASREE